MNPRVLYFILLAQKCIIQCLIISITLLATCIKANAVMEFIIDL